MKRKIAQICFVLLIFLCCIFSFNAFAGDHEFYYPRTAAGGAAVSQSFLLDVAAITKYGAWIRYTYTDSTDIYSKTTTESTSYDSSGIAIGTTVTVDEQEYTSYNNPYDE